MQIHAAEFRKEFGKVHKRIDMIDIRLDGIDVCLDKIDQKLIWQRTALTNIDGRLDDIELEFLPKRVSRIEKKLQMQS